MYGDGEWERRGGRVEEIRKEDHTYATLAGRSAHGWCVVFRLRLSLRERSDCSADGDGRRPER